MCVFSTSYIEPIPAFVRCSVQRSNSFRNRSFTDAPKHSNYRAIAQRVKKLTRTRSTEDLVLFDDSDQNELVNSLPSTRSNTPVNSTAETSISGSKARAKYQSESYQYESLDYDICENMLHLEDENRKKDEKDLEISRWLVIFIIGVLTGLTACFILFCVQTLTKYKYKNLMVIFLFLHNQCYVVMFVFSRF